MNVGWACANTLVRRSFISNPRSSICRIKVLHWLIGYLICMVAQITSYKYVDRANVPLKIYYSPKHYIVAGGIR